jgi:outer membrane protein assembly factor BamB
VKALERLVRDLFCSRFTDRALDLLGDLAFERGDFARAISWWRLLGLPAAEVRTAETLLFPRPHVDLARIRAKFIIARTFEGEREQAARELKVFRAIHAKARGKLAGKDGEYAAIVEEVIRRAPAAADDETWSTFAGSPGRNRVAASSPSPRSWANGPTWRVGLPNAGMPEPGGLFSHLAGRLYYHPVIADDRVLLTNGRSVLGYDLLSGRMLFRYDLQAARRVTFAPLPPDAAPPALRFTLSVAGDRVYARLGDQAIGPANTQGRSFLVCLEIPPAKSAGQPGQLQEVWAVPAPDESQFEGAPLMHAGLAYIASSHVENRRTKTSLHCYDAASGKQRWLQQICDTPEFEETTATRYRHHLLTLAVDNIVYCSHSGAVVAVDRMTGKQAWAMRYSARKSEIGEPAPPVRDLCPCVFHFGRLFVAPADTDRLYCLDSSSGQLLWDRDRVACVNLLGIAGDHLLLTEQHGLRALRAQTGLDAWRQPSDGGALQGLGRALLVGDRIFWPTRNPNHAIFVVAQKDGEQLPDDPTGLRQIRAGNMAFGNGCLVVAGSDYLFGYVPPERLLRKLQAETKSRQASAWTIYQRQNALGLGRRRDIPDFDRVIQARRRQPGSIRTE